MEKKLFINAFLPIFLTLTFLFVLFGLISKKTEVSFQSGWTLQTDLQSQLRGRTVNDMTFIDSVTGFAVTNGLSQTDTCFVFKTTNGGDNWFVNYWTNETYANAFFKIAFPDSNIGYICGGGGNSFICKTTDRGNTWVKTSVPLTLSFIGMSCLNKDTVYVINSESLTGGIFRTTNGGQNWQNIYAAGQYNPQNIYMYNTRIGFYSDATSNLYKTTDGGFIWPQVYDTGFYKIQFLDSLTGYKAHGNFQKTTNGGLNWISQTFPNVIGGSTFNVASNFSITWRDTIWAVGSIVEFPNFVFTDRGIINKTTNGGINWGYQLPDTHTVQTYSYHFIQFIRNRYGWAYMTNGKGVHTTTGGDSTIYTNIKEQTTNIFEQYKLFQNYPNPFNPVTSIKYQVSRISNVKLVVYNITGKEINVLVNEKKSPGIYEVKFNGSNLPTGIYFYSLYIDGIRMDTKKLVLLK